MPRGVLALRRSARFPLGPVTQLRQDNASHREPPQEVGPQHSRRQPGRGRDPRALRRTCCPWVGGGGRRGGQKIGGKRPCSHHLPESQMLLKFPPWSISKALQQQHLTEWELATGRRCMEEGGQVQQSTRRRKRAEQTLYPEVLLYGVESVHWQRETYPEPPWPVLTTCVSRPLLY